MWRQSLTSVEPSTVALHIFSMIMGHQMHRITFKQLSTQQLIYQAWGCLWLPWALIEYDRSVLYTLFYKFCCSSSEFLAFSRKTREFLRILYVCNYSEHTSILGNTNYSSCSMGWRVFWRHHMCNQRLCTINFLAADATCVSFHFRRFSNNITAI